MALREIAWGGNPAMSSPLNSIRPLVGRSTPVRQLKNVDFPAPLGPMIPRISPRGTEMVTLLTAARPPNRTVSASVLRMGDELSTDTRAAKQRGAPGNPGRPERWGGWGAMSGPPLRLMGPCRGPPSSYPNLHAGG